MSPALPPRVNAPSTTVHPSGICACLKPRQPAVLFPSNNGRQCEACGAEEIGAVTATARTSTAVVRIIGPLLRVVDGTRKWNGKLLVPAGTGIP
jgi:hypothetical protein